MTTRTSTAGESIATAHAAAVEAERAAQAAAQEQADACGLAESLERRVASGDDQLTPEEITSSRSLADFAKLRARGAASKAAAARAAHRQAQLAALAAEIVAHDEDPHLFATALATMETAVEAFCALATDRTEQLGKFRRRMHDLDVTEGRRPGPVFWDGPHLGAGERTLAPFDAGVFVAAVVARAGARHGLQVGGRALADRVPDLHPIPGEGGVADLDERLRRSL